MNYDTNDSKESYSKVLTLINVLLVSTLKMNVPECQNVSYINQVLSYLETFTEETRNIFLYMKTVTAQETKTYFTD